MTDFIIGILTGVALYIALIVALAIADAIHLWWTGKDLPMD